MDPQPFTPFAPDEDLSPADKLRLQIALDTEVWMVSIPKELRPDNPMFAVAVEKLREAAISSPFAAQYLGRLPRTCPEIFRTVNDPMYLHMLSECMKLEVEVNPSRPSPLAEFMWTCGLNAKEVYKVLVAKNAGRLCIELSCTPRIGDVAGNMFALYLVTAVLGFAERVYAPDVCMALFEMVALEMCAVKAGLESNSPITAKVVRAYGAALARRELHTTDTFDKTGILFSNCMHVLGIAHTSWGKDEPHTFPDMSKYRAFTAAVVEYSARSAAEARKAAERRSRPRQTPAPWYAAYHGHAFYPAPPRSRPSRRRAESPAEPAPPAPK